MAVGIADRVAGGVIGSAVGDAVGAPCECCDYRKIRNFVGDYQGPDQLIGRPGPQPWWKDDMAWRVTDDTVLADLLLDCIMRHKGQVSAYEFAREWELFDKPAPTPDGSTVNRLSLVHFIEQIPFLRNKLAIYKRDLGRGECNATNAIMYIAPVGLLCAGSPLEAEQMAVDMTSVNQHGRPRDVAGGYCAALAECFIPGKSVDDIVGVAIDHTRDFLCLKEISAMVNLARKCSSPDEYIERYYTEIIGPVIPYIDLQHEMFNPDMCNSWRSSEILGNALAFLLITKGNDARAMILGASKIGRDADTIARVAAGLIGAYRGLSSLPQEWVQAVLKKNAWLNLESKTQQLVDIVQSKLAERARLCAAISVVQ